MELGNVLIAGAMLGKMNKKDFVIVKCKVCQAKFLGIRYQQNVQKIPEFAICTECYNDLP